MRHRSPDDLFCVSIAQKLGHVLSDRDSCIRMLDVAPSDVVRTGLGSTFLIGSLVPRAAVFAIQHDLLTDALETIGPETLELPPLPFPQIILESEEDATWPLVGETTGEILRIQNLYIAEEEPGKRWNGFYFVQVGGQLMPGRQDEGHGSVLFTVPFTLDSGSLVILSPKGTSSPYPSTDVRWRFAVEVVHLITARGVSLSLVSGDRASRRRAIRRGSAVHPRVYWVNVDEKSINHVKGAEAREYHCRWIVRGHWRRLDEDRRTWVKAYIKGPAGAPWKGRPVYRVAT